VNPGTQEAKTVEPMFEASLGKGIETLSQKESGVVVHICNPNYSGGGSKMIESQDWPGQKQSLYLKITQKHKKDMVQMVEPFSPKDKTLCSILSTKKKKKKIWRS
jgi:hypothetical protein